VWLRIDTSVLIFLAAWRLRNVPGAARSFRIPERRAQSTLSRRPSLVVRGIAR